MLETRDEWINLFFDNVRNKRDIDKPAFEEGRSSESSRAGSNPAPLTKKMKGFGYSSFNEIFF